MNLTQGTDQMVGALNSVINPATFDVAVGQLFSYYLMDARFEKIQMSPAARLITLFELEDADAFHSCMDEQGAKSHKDVLQSVLMTKGGFKTTYRYKKPDNSWISIEEKGMVTFDEKGQPSGFICSISDITVQEKLKSDFQSALGMAKFPLENPLPVFRVDKTSKLLFANKSSIESLQSLGLSSGIITDKNFNKVLSEAIGNGSNERIVHKVGTDKVYSMFLVPQQGRYVNVYCSDISESLKLQEILQDRLSELNTILDSTDELIILISENLDIISANKTFKQSIATALSMDFVPGSNLSMLGRFDFFETLKSDIATCFAEGAVSVKDFAIRRNQSQIEYFEIKLNPIRRRGTNFISGVCLRIKDITIQKSNFEILNSQKSLYESILDNIPAEIGIFNKDHQYQYVNPAGIRDKNLRQWIIGKNDYDYCAFRNIDNRIADERSFLFKKVIETGKEQDLETYHTNKDGSTKHVLRRFYPFTENGELKMMIGYGIDITAIKKAQQNIKINEARYRALFENNPLPVVVMDMNGIVISLNDAFCKDTGFPMNNILGNNIINFLSDKGKDAYPEWLVSYKKDPHTHYHREIKVLNANGRFSDYEISLTRLNWDENTPCVLIVANNITERKQNARLLEESERLNRRLLQELPVSVVTMIQGNITNVNQSFLDLLGVDLEQVIETPLTRWMPNQDRQLFEKNNYDLFSGKDSVACRVHLIRTDGITKTVDIRESMFEMKKNMVTMAVINDVTDMVAAEELRQEIEQRGKMIIESALDGIILTDSKLEIVEWNSKSAEIFMWNDQDVSGINLNEFFNVSDANSLLNEGLFEMEGLRSEKVTFPTEVFAARLHSTKKELLVFYVRDISERIAASNKLRESERIDNILNQFSAEIYQLDEVNDVLNRMIATFHSICDLCHITIFQTEEGGNNPMRIDGVGEAFSLPVWNDVVLIPSTKTDIVDQANRSCSMLIKTGTESGMEKSELAVPITIDSKTWGIVRFETGFTGLFSEGNQHIIKKMIDATSTRLSKILDENKMIKLNRELVQNNAQLQQYSYIVSHNLRAPIANLLGLSRLFNVKNLLDERNLKVIRNIESSAGNIDSILKDLNKILAIKKELAKEKEEVSLDDIIYQVLKTLEKEFIEVKPKIDLDMQVTRLMTIKSYITSIFTNLISNSIKYRAPDRECQIIIRTAQNPRGITVEFEDNGLGIDMEKFGEHIFGLYKRYHRHVEGTGMGLHLVKSQVEAMNGTISVESTLDKGTKFIIQLYHD